jgi:predicted GNAT family acetyltransferase
MDIEREENGSKGSFFVMKDGVRAAEMTYSRAGAKRIIIDHTDVSEALRGTGAGKQLVLAGVAWARQEGLTVIPLCPFAAAMFEKDPSLRDVLSGAEGREA